MGIGLFGVSAGGIREIVASFSQNKRNSVSREQCLQKTGKYGCAHRPPGTLLLNMLVKNEEEHLTRTLPKWAKLIDYWIIGVDEDNSDDSVAVIKRTIGHIPGHIVTVIKNG